MKIKILIPFLAFLFILPISSCKKVNTTEEVPNCIKRKIRKDDRKSNFNLSSVTKYDYKSSEIYEFYYHGVSGTTYIFDADCNELCSNQDVEGRILCDKILDIATNNRVIWTGD
jgi:hypothetical protein